ncbi:MAG: hypothetical protein CVU87_07660 [Firmicutes bacterium HGW-Firmicutes-12]|jgi:flagellin|nr:MAG: hypothetical protein CVU87_07660 [Firmicutes bacterium HGW-Firmicutes-12]
MRINHNIAALNAWRGITQTDSALGKSLEKLSSGLRINRAGDDAAGLAISEKMRGQVRGLNQANRNSQDVISMIQTAEGALTETHSILQRMRELAVQASNDTNTSDDRAEMQREINQLSSEINRIGNTTEFNTKKVLNGASGSAAALGAGSTISNASVTGTIDPTITAGTNKVYSVNLTAAGTAEIETSRALVVSNATDTLTTASATVADPAAKTIIAIDVAAATSINDIAGVAFIADSSGGAVDAADAIAGANVHMFSDIDTFTSYVDTIAAGHVAVFADGTDQVLVASGSAVTDDTNDNFAVLTKDYDGAALALTSQLDNEDLFGTGWGGGTIDIAAGGKSVTVAVAEDDTLADFISNVNSALDTAEMNVQLSYNATNTNLVFTSTQVGSANDVTITEGFGGRSLHIANDNTGATASADVAWTVTDQDTGVGTNYTSATGRSIANTASGVSGVALNFSATTGTQEVTVSNGELSMQIGANAGQTLKASFSDMRGLAIELTSTASGASQTAGDGSVAHFTSGTANVENNGATNQYALDVSTAAYASAAVSAIDDAIGAVSTERSRLGAYQNRLEHTINNLGTSAENMTAAESRIRDVDMAAEMMEFTKQNILAQAGTAMLAQANQRPQQVLQLLQ